MAVLVLIAEVTAELRQRGFGLVMIFALAAWLYWLYCVYKFHDVLGNIPGYDHPISPTRAVTRHFIPLYNLYWIFKWPEAIATFVNLRTQSQTMSGPLVGLLLLLSGFVSRALDGFLGLMLLFTTGVYISRRIEKALVAPPGVLGPLGL